MHIFITLRRLLFFDIIRFVALLHTVFHFCWNITEIQYAGNHIASLIAEINYVALHLCVCSDTKICKLFVNYLKIVCLAYVIIVNLIIFLLK